MAEVKMSDLFEQAHACLSCCDAQEKVRLSQATAKAWRDGQLSLQQSQDWQPVDQPGRPDRPLLVPPRSLSKRGTGKKQAHAALIHAVVHIEFNAINLAWDVVHRFRGMPRDYYDDWVQVADEEALHFTLLREHLLTLGYDYGDFDAHNGLWEMATSTAHDLLVRLALVPRVLEARGLDVTPGMILRLEQAGDQQGADILRIILRDEVGHVAAGSRWFRYLCEQRGCDAEQTFWQLVETHMGNKLSGPYNWLARAEAGFSKSELAHLK